MFSNSFIIPLVVNMLGLLLFISYMILALKRETGLRSIRYLTEDIKKTMEDIMLSRNEEPNNMNKTTYGKAYNPDTEMLGLFPAIHKEVLKNKLDLEQLSTNEASEEDYAHVLGCIMSLVKHMYANYQFNLHKPTFEDHESGYLVQFVVAPPMYKQELNYLFQFILNKGIDQDKLKGLFIDALVDDKVIDFGEAVLIPEQSGTSPMSSNESLMVNITFMPKEYYERYQAEHEDTEKDEVEDNDRG